MKQLFYYLLLAGIAFFTGLQPVSGQWNGANPLWTNSSVGIGTPSPSQKLQVSGGNILLDYANTGFGNLYFGGVTAPPPPGNPANGMRLSFFSSPGAGFKNGFIDVRTRSGTAYDGLLFRVDDNFGGIERMRICANGNIGIGTAAPDHRLQVHAGVLANNAPVKFADSEGRRIIFVPKLGTSGYNNLSLTNDAGIFWADNSTGYNTTAGLVIAPHDNNRWAGLRLDADGKVAIPGFNASIGAGISKLALGHAYGADMGWGTSYIGFNAARSKTVGSAPGTWTIDGDGANNGGGVIWGDVSGGIRFATLANTGATPQTLADIDIINRTKMYIGRDGKVTIGDRFTATNTAGAYLLYVRTGILTEKVTVALHGTGQWADHVFGEGYPLARLEEVEAYIKQEKHLPNVPSAQEIADNGLDLADMQARQMEKIEEITLYLIEMKKEIEALKRENATLKAALAKH